MLLTNVNMKKPSIEVMLEYLNIKVTLGLKKVLKYLKKGKVDENKIAELMKVRVNDVRKLIYKLSHKGYAVYTKEKSESRQWWYVYTWDLDKHKIERDYVAEKIRELDSVKAKLVMEKKTEFRCAECNKRFSYEEALDVGFICLNCSGALNEIKRRMAAAKLEREVGRLEKDIEVVIGTKK